MQWAASVKRNSFRKNSFQACQSNLGQIGVPLVVKKRQWNAQHAATAQLVGSTKGPEGSSNPGLHQERTKEICRRTISGFLLISCTEQVRVSKKIFSYKPFIFLTYWPHSQGTWNNNHSIVL